MSRCLQRVCDRVECTTKRFFDYAQLASSDDKELLKTILEAKRKTLRKESQRVCINFKNYVDGLSCSEIVQSLREHFQMLTFDNCGSWIQELSLKTESKFDTAKAKLFTKSKFFELLNKWENESFMLESQRNEMEVEVIRQLSKLTITSPVEIYLPGLQFRLLRVRRNIIAALRQPYFKNLHVSRDKTDSKTVEKRMESMAKRTLEKLLCGNALEQLVKTSLGLTEVVNVFEKEVKKEIDIALEEVDDLRKIKQADHSTSTYKSFVEECKIIRENLFHWEIDHLLGEDFVKSSNVTLASVSEKYLLGSGSIFAYYNGVMQGVDRQKELVTIKRYVLQANLDTVIRDYKRLR